MKNALIGLAILAFIVFGVMFVLVGMASPENAPQDVKVIELPDTYEK